MTTSGAPKQIGRYTVVGHLADGGMAEIILGKLIGESGFERPVVIKRILPHLARDQAFVDMFLDEARLAAGIRHPNVVQVQELGRDGAELFIIMEYLSGETTGGLMRRVSPAGPLEPAIAGHIVAEACAGLHAAHELAGPDGERINLVHRDISPDNLFITYDGEVKVLDFGVAQAVGRLTKTQTGTVKGKFSYMSPEQCLGEVLDPRSDIWALGVVLYEISTGRRLFKRKNELLVMKAICEEPITAPSARVDGYPKALEAVVLRALARKKEDRFDSAKAMRQAILAAIGKIETPELPEDGLRTLMQRTFPERILEKQKMLRDVKAGIEMEKLPAAELSGDPWSDVTSLERREPSSPAKRPGSKRSRLLIAIPLALAALALSWGLTRGVTTTPPVARPVVPVAPVAPVATVATEITAELESTPPGATVIVDGVARGETPLSLKLPRGQAAVAIELRKPGWSTVKETLHPDTDQRLRLALTPEKPAPSPMRPGGPKAPPKQSPKATPQPSTPPDPQKGFHRFD